MFEDLIDQNQKPKNKVSWDIDKYEKKAYCYICGSTKVTVLRDHLTSKTLEKDVQCDQCGAMWREIWDKDIKLGIKKVTTDLIKF
jgi:hypothetical protein